MSRWPAWNELAPAHRAKLEALLTDEQKTTFVLAGAGYGIRRMALIQDVSETTIKRRLAKLQKLLKAAFDEERTAA